MPVYSDITNEDLISTLDKIDEDIAVARSKTMLAYYHTVLLCCMNIVFVFLT